MPSSRYFVYDFVDICRILNILTKSGSGFRAIMVLYDVTDCHFKIDTPEGYLSKLCNS